MKNEKKHNSKRRLLLLILLLVCTLILLGGSTYAWFTANTKVAIQPMQIQVEVANGIEISADAKHWSPRITLDDLYKAAGIAVDEGSATKSEDAGSVNQFPGKLNNISGVGNVKESDNRLELFKGTANNVCYDSEGIRRIVENDEYAGANAIPMEDCDTSSPMGVGLIETSLYDEGKTSCKGTGEATGNCGSGIQAITFDIYLKLDNDSFVSLAPGSYVNNLENTTDFGLKNTIRVAFITLGTQPSNFYYADEKDVAPEGMKIGEEDFGGKLVTNTDVDGSILDAPMLNTNLDVNDYINTFGGYTGVYGARQMNGFGGIDIWEPNANTHTKGGKDNAENNYGIKEADLATAGTNALYKEIKSSDKGNPSDPDDPELVLPIFLSDTIGNTTYFAKQKAVASADVNTATGPYRNVINYFQTNAGKVGEPQRLFAAYRGVTKVRVYMWVEGQDVDTENNATSSTVDAMLSFTTAGDAQPTSADFETYSADRVLTWVPRTNADPASYAINYGTFSTTPTPTTSGA